MQSQPLSSAKGKEEPSSEPYWSEVAVAAGIQAGTVLVGELKVTKWTKSVAFVKNRNLFPLGCNALVHGVGSRNRAMHGDVVAVQILEWRDSAGADADENPEIQAGPAPVEDSITTSVARDVVELPPEHAVLRTALETTNAKVLEIRRREPFPWNAGQQPSCRVVHIFSSTPRRLPCRCMPNRNPEHSLVQMKPYDERYPIVMLPLGSLPDPIQREIEEFLLLLEFDSGWPMKNRFPPANFLTSLGYARNAEAESRAILCMYNVVDEPFSHEVEACVGDFVVPPVGAPLPEGRTDLRESEFVCTIDPATARDLDDAISIKELPQGTFRVGVHIADVSHFVPVGTALDDEAQRRSTSVYLVERVIPMLPRRLSEDHCSLNTGSDKYAFSILWEMTRTGEIIPGTEWFGQSIIRNRCRLTYEQAQMILEEDPAVEETLVVEDLDHKPKVIRAVKSMWSLAKRMRQRRMDCGAIDVGKSKLSFKFEDPNSRLAPVDFFLYSAKEGNNLVEEFMLLANQRVAEKIHDFLPKTTLLRKHDRPDPKKLLAFVRCAREAGYEIDNSSQVTLSKSLLQGSKGADAEALATMTVRSMKLAQYCASVDGPVSHYALNMDRYTHFTSPIRRYADLVVHRSLLLALEIEKVAKLGEVTKVDPLTLSFSRYFLNISDVGMIAEHCNEKDDLAAKASDASGKLFLCLFLEARRKIAAKDPSVAPYYRTEAVVVRVEEKFFTVTLLGLALEQDIYHNNADGKGLQKWAGTNEFMKDSQAAKVEWCEGSTQQIRMLTRLTATIVVTPRSPMDFVAVIHPPAYAGRDMPVEELIKAAS
jgi:DIS3-like exonuclease 2